MLDVLICDMKKWEDNGLQILSSQEFREEKTMSQETVRPKIRVEAGGFFVYLFV